MRHLTVFRVAVIVALVPGQAIAGSLAAIMRLRDTTIHARANTASNAAYGPCR
jgi:hypothetical protein